MQYWRGGPRRDAISCVTRMRGRCVSVVCVFGVQARKGGEGCALSLHTVVSPEGDLMTRQIGDGTYLPTYRPFPRRGHRIDDFFTFFLLRLCAPIARLGPRREQRSHVPTHGAYPVRLAAAASMSSPTGATRAEERSRRGTETAAGGLPICLAWPIPSPSSQELVSLPSGTCLNFPQLPPREIVAHPRFLTRHG
jgi:hypothetical protein